MIQLPENIWLQIKDNCLDYGIVVDLKLKDGSVRKSFAVNRNGQIEGKIVGGQDGVSPTLIDFSTEQISAARLEGKPFSKWIAC